MILLLLVVNKILSIICGMSQNSHFFLSFYVFNITAGNNRNNNNNNKYIYFHTKKKHYQLHRIIIRQTNNNNTMYKKGCTSAWKMGKPEATIFSHK